jgi:hypothetical protein
MHAGMNTQMTFFGYPTTTGTRLGGLNRLERNGRSRGIRP